MAYQNYNKLYSLKIHSGEIVNNFDEQKTKINLNYLKKVSISVVCSRWQEPFGRVSLESTSRGAAVIISNRGGLLETTRT